MNFTVFYDATGSPLVLLTNSFKRNEKLKIMDVCKLCSLPKEEDELIETQGSFLLLKPGVVDFCDVISEVFGSSKVCNPEIKFF